MSETPDPSHAVATSWRRRVVKLAAEAVDLVRPGHHGVVVLIYHRVGRRSSQSVDLPVAQFDDQMAELAESGRVVTLDAAIDMLTAAAPAPTLQPDPVVVTFDDGTADLAELATPVLERHRVPATLYVATDFVDRSLPFPDDGVALSWSALADMASTGLWQIGSHTHTHALLDRLADDQIADELDRSIALIGDHLGRPPTHFAYPKALAPSPAADLAVRTRFRSAALAGTRVNRFGATDPWLLARTPIQVEDGGRWFRRKAVGGMTFEDDLRRTVNRVRYAGART
ncbi:MAG: polysaccharide deacetylase family protein [Acidimicrobiales bacterium]